MHFCGIALALAGNVALVLRVREYQPPWTLTLSIALDGDKDELRLPAGNMWITPSHDHAALCDAYEADPDSAPIPAVFISFPSAKDPTWAGRCPGKSTCQIIADGGGWDRWDA